LLFFSELMSSFRKYGGRQYAAKNNIVRASVHIPSIIIVTTQLGFTNTVLPTGTVLQPLSSTPELMYSSFYSSSSASSGGT
jgi:hypothetical protein